MKFKLRDFKENGYSVHRTEDIDQHASTWSKWFCQKRVRDGAGDTEYFINLYISDMRLWDGWSKNIYLGTCQKSLSIKLQVEVWDFRVFKKHKVKYNEEENELTMNTITTDITLSSGDWLTEVSDIEKCVDKMFRSLICRNYSY